MNQRNTPPKKSSSKAAKRGKAKNPAAMKNPPKSGGSVMKTGPEDIEEFKQRTKVAKKLAEGKG